MPDDERRDIEDRQSKAATKWIWVGVGVMAILIVAGIFWLKRQPSPPTPATTVDQHLEGAIRSDSPEFAQLMEGIRMDEPEATQDHTALGGLSMNLFTTVRNFTGKNITGLEMKGTVVDSAKNPVKSRTLIVIPGPTRQAMLENTRALPVRIRIEGFKATDDRANIKVEITGLKVD